MSKYLLHINKPCTQSWDEMTATKNGKFCSNCQKEVIDFTTFTEAEIINYFKKAKDNEVCGKFYETQVNHWLEDLHIKNKNPLLYKFLFSFLLLSNTEQSFSQSTTLPKEINITQGLSGKVKGLNVQRDTTSNCTKSKAENFENVRITLGGARIVKTESKPLVILDGKVINSKALENLNPNNISSITILKHKEATALYGPDGVNGALLITTKACNNVETSPFSAL
jgi:TonB-dependent SusC/RagA subfamily outer membrane receptor